MGRGALRGYKLGGPEEPGVRGARGRGTLRGPTKMGATGRGALRGLGKGDNGQRRTQGWWTGGKGCRGALRAGGQGALGAEAHSGNKERGGQRAEAYLGLVERGQWVQRRTQGTKKGGTTGRGVLRGYRKGLQQEEAH